MREDIPDTIDLLDEKFQNVTCIIFFILTSEIERIDWFFDFWKGRDIIRIIEWEKDDKYEWAIHIDLAKIEQPGEEAILPFPWAEDTNPNVDEGTLAWRLYANKE